MDNTCAICMDVIGKDRATTECGHVFHTRCFANNIALNVGNEEGTTRHLCVLCRDSVCEPVQPSKNITIRLDDLTVSVDDLTVNVEVLSNTNAGWAIYCEKIEKENEDLQMNYLKEKFISRRRLEIIRARLPPIDFVTAVVRIQNWLRCVSARKTATLEKHRQAWTIYKNIVKECFIFETSTHEPVPDSTNIYIWDDIMHINTISNES